MSEQIMDLNEDALALLDRELDDIEDLPGFECPVNGQYILGLKTAVKEVNDKQCVEAQYEVMECLKKDNDSEPDTVKGTKFSQLFFLQGSPEAVKMSVGTLKALMKPIGEQVGNGNLLFLVKEHCAGGIIISATVTGKKDKENPEIRRPRLSNVQPQ